MRNGTSREDVVTQWILGVMGPREKRKRAMKIWTLRLLLLEVFIVSPFDSLRLLFVCWKRTKGIVKEIAQRKKFFTVAEGSKGEQLTMS